MMHRCPRLGCKAQVLNIRFACYPDWMELSKETQNLIWETARLRVLDPRRRAAIQAARDEWAGDYRQL
jgi:hypothetical protein